jgi:hypothetical protein
VCNSITTCLVFYKNSSLRDKSSDEPHASYFCSLGNNIAYFSFIALFVSESIFKFVPYIVRECAPQSICNVKGITVLKKPPFILGL